MLVEALERYHHFYGESLQVECPTGSGHRIAGRGRAGPLSASCGPVRPDADGRRPCATGTTRASATIRGATSSRSRSTSVVTAAAASARATRAGRRLPSVASRTSRGVGRSDAQGEDRKARSRRGGGDGPHVGGRREQRHPAAGKACAAPVVEGRERSVGEPEVHPSTAEGRVHGLNVRTYYDPILVDDFGRVRPS